VRRGFGQVKQEIKARARDLGFDDCRITTAIPPVSAGHFRKWLADKFHGEMGYLERNADKRVEPDLVLAEAKTIITFAISYFDERAKTDPASQPAQPTGVVARYARYSDYHKVIGNRLKTLTGFVNQLGPSETRSLWYVDTGPLLERDLAQRAGL